MLSIRSDAATNATDLWQYDPQGDLAVRVEYATPDGTTAYEGRLRANSSNVFRAYDSANQSRAINVSIGSNNGVWASFNLSYSGVQPQWNVTMTKVLAGGAFSRWNYADVLSQSAGIYARNSSVAVNVPSRMQ